RVPIFVFEQPSDRTEFARALDTLAPVHHDYLSIDISAAVAHQKCSEIGEFLHSPKATDRNALGSCGLQVRTGQYAREGTFGGDRPGSNGVHADSAVSPLNRQTARQRLHSRLSHGGRNNIR